MKVLFILPFSNAEPIRLCFSTEINFDKINRLHFIPIYKFKSYTLFIQALETSVAIFIKNATER